MRFKVDKNKAASWLESNFDCKMSSDGEWMRICNPFDDDKKYRLNFHLNSGIAHDFRPGHFTGGTLVGFVKEYLHITAREAINTIGSAKAVTRSIQTKSVVDEYVVELPPRSKPISNNDNSMLGRIAVGFLSRRCITIDQAIDYGIHYDADSVVFPFVEFGVLITWMRRSIIGKFFEYPPGPRGEWLYGIDEADHNSTVIITESVIDSINIGPGALAKGGGTLTVGQVRKLRLLNPQAIILAPDRGAEKSLWKEYDLLSNNYPVVDLRYCLPSDDVDSDWNDMKRVGRSPRDYILNNCRKLDKKELIKMRMTNVK